nr:hypothetical protein [Tanacetum cinerariifolium]
MIAILEKTEHNIDFHHIVDFLEAFHISNIATDLVCLATNRVFNFSKMIFDGMGEGSATLIEPHHTTSPQEQHSPHHDPSSPSHPTTTTEPIPYTPTKTPTLRRYTRRATRIAQSIALSPAADKPASLLRDDIQGEAFPTARVKFLEDKDRGSAEPTQEDAPIKGGIMKTGEEVRADKSTKLGSNDTDEMVHVPSSMEAANILTSRVAAVSVSPVVGVSTKGVPTVSGLFPTASAIFTTASVLARDSEIARLHAKEELKMMIEGLDRSNKVIIKHLQEYEQDEAELTIGERIELINELKQPEDFVPMSSKEEGKRVKRKGLKLDQGTSKRMKTSKDVSEEDLKGMMQLVPLEEVYVEALQVKHPIIDWEIQSEEKKEEDLHQLWTLVKETLSIKQATKDQEKELWVKLKRLFEPDFEDQLWTHNQAFMHDPLDWKLYDTCGVHHVFTKD